MAPADSENPVFNVKVSSTVPSRATAENKTHEFTNMDLIMKLHYIRGLYFFRSDAFPGCKFSDFKYPTFPWLDILYMTTGRIRRSDGGRPFVKCNDSGIRYIEAQCNKTIDEWLASSDQSLDNRLIYSDALGPDLFFSPLVYLQVTLFKCGGVSVGFRWAHVLGDPFSAITYMNLYGQFLSGHKPKWSLRAPNAGKSKALPSISGKPSSVKRVDAVGDCWVTANNCKMEMHSFHVTAKQLELLQSKVSGLGQTVKIRPFEVLSALTWKSLAKIREDSGPRIVTICQSNSHDRENEIPSNGQTLSVVEADFSVAKADLSELTELIAEKTVDENRVIEEIMERENANVDFIVYGANLTFVNLEDARIYGMEIRGHKPVSATYNIDGVGDEGVVLVLPGQENGKDEGGGCGRTLNVTLPENQLAELKNELKREWGIL